MTAPSQTFAPSLASLGYDRGTYAANLRQSVGPGQYVLAAYAEPHCQPCLQFDPRVTVGTTGASTCASPVDVESDLHNLTRPATRSPDGLYRGGGCGPTVCGPSRPLPGCAGLATVDTRLVDPPCTLRGTGWNRWQWLCQDPQRTALLPFDALIDTSLVVKDNHRPHLARPVDPTLALPPRSRDADAAAGAPDWMPGCGGAGLSGLPVGAVGESPIVLWRGCGEVQRLQQGCRA